MRRWPRRFSIQFLRLALVLGLAVAIAACTTRIETIREIEVTRVVEVGAAATPLPPAEPRLLTVLVGAGADPGAAEAARGSGRRAGQDRRGDGGQLGVAGPGFGQAVKRLAAGDRELFGGVRGRLCRRILGLAAGRDCQYSQQAQQAQQA